MRWLRIAVRVGGTICVAVQSTLRTKEGPSPETFGSVHAESGKALKCFAVTEVQP
jgi:hypothetical protein